MNFLQTAYDSLNSQSVSFHSDITFQISMKENMT